MRKTGFPQFCENVLGKNFALKKERTLRIFRKVQELRRKSKKIFFVRAKDCLTRFTSLITIGATFEEQNGFLILLRFFVRLFAPSVIVATIPFPLFLFTFLTDKLGYARGFEKAKRVENSLATSFSRRGGSAENRL